MEKRNGLWCKHYPQDSSLEGDRNAAMKPCMLVFFLTSHRDRETIKIDTQSKHQRGPALMLSQTREEIVPEAVVTEQGIYRKFHMEN